MNSKWQSCNECTQATREMENLSYRWKLKEADSFSTAKQKARVRYDQEAEKIASKVND